MILCRVAFVATLGCMWPAGPGGTPLVQTDVLRVYLNHGGDSALHFPHPTTVLLSST